MPTFRQTSALLTDAVDLTRPVHALTMTGRTMCGTDARTHVTSAYGTEVTCEPCRSEWSPATRDAIDRMRCGCERSACATCTPPPVAGDRVYRADNGSRAPIVPPGSAGRVLRVIERGWLVVEWDQMPGATYTYRPDDDRLA